MDNQQIPKADSEFQKIARKNHRKWKLRLLSKGGQKADSGGSPYDKKPDYNRAKSAPPGFGGLEESKRLDEVIRKKGRKYCLFSKKTKRNLGCYPTRSGAVKREKQVQYFKHLKEMIYREILNILSETKKKEDRCTRIAKSKYDAWPSAYASGAVVKCRQGKIWKNIKEEEELEEIKKPSKAKHLAKKGVALAAAASTMLGAKDQENLQKSKKAKTEKHVVAEEELDEKWSEKYKKSIDCKNPKGFSQRAHCQGRKKRD